MLVAMPSSYHLKCGKCSHPWFIFRFLSSFVYRINELALFFENISKSNKKWRFPFDWKCASGYLIAIVLQFLAIAEGLIFLTCLTSLVLGYFLFAFSFTKDVSNNLRSLNDLASTGSCEADIFKEFNGFVSFHSHLKQLSEISNAKTTFAWHE